MPPKRQCKVVLHAPPKKVKKGQNKALDDLKAATKSMALKTLLDKVNDNNGKLGIHYISTVAEMYNIDRQDLYYLWYCHKKTVNTSMSGTPTTGRNTIATTAITPTSINSRITGTLETPNITMINTPTDSVMEVDNSNTGSTDRTKVSRKQKKIIEKKQRALILESRTQAAQQFSNAQKAAVGKVASGTLKEIITSIETENNLEPGTINPGTIKSRVNRNNLTGYNPQTTPPLALIEPFLVELCFRMGRIGKGLQKPIILQLCSELMKNTEHEKKYRRFIIDKSQTSVVPGNHWYTKFLKRHSEKLNSVKENIMDANRKTYCVKENFMRMYDNVYNHMTEAGVAIKIEKEIMLDKNGTEVFSRDEIYGLPTQYLMTRPDNVVFMDETGCNTNQKKDGKVGGERYVVPADGSGNGCTGSTTDMHFSLACFTSGLGNAVMCAIIFTSERDSTEIPLSWKSGINRTVAIDESITLDFTNFIQEATKPGGLLAGGPTCYHNGKTIPCFYGSSPHGGITGQMLADMLKHLDDLHVFERSNSIKPFLLIDGHNSRFSLEFLSYIHGEGHEWTVCIGVPYGTHLWQVADSPELNAGIKAGLTKAKRAYLANNKGTRDGFSPSDICPLVCAAWAESFGNQEFGKKAIAQRGWGPLNYILLQHPQLKDVDEHSCSSEALDPEDNNFFCINLKGPSVEVVMDKLVERLVLDEGRREAYKRRKENAEEYEDRYKTVRELGRLSSGTLTSQNHYVLGKELYEVSKERADLEMAKEGERLEKKNRREQLAKEKFDISSALFRTDVAKVKANDYRVVLNYTRKKDESPTKTRLLDMQHQFNSRNCTARMLCFEPSTSPVDTDISSIEETDQLLCDAFDCFVENLDSFDSFVENFDEASDDAINPIFLDMTSFTFENETALPTSNTF